MATFDDWDLVEPMIKANGALYEDEPPVSKIVEYTNAWGKQAYGVVWADEDDQERYNRETAFVQRPRTIFVRKYEKGDKW